nr:MAG TPA: Trm112p-like protein [Herelleviridae sp.]
MLSSKIDLTENSDFGAHDILESLSLNIDLDDFMLPFNLKYKQGKYLYIFGEKEYEHQIPITFGKTNDYYNDDGDHCICCGTLIRIPWDKKGLLCEKCNERFESKDSRSTVFFTLESTVTEQQDAKDVFILR